jgi:hypothetical protein
MTERTRHGKNYTIRTEPDKLQFTPFILHLKIDSRETADNIIKLLKPIIYAGGQCSAYHMSVNKEQRQWAEDMANLISKNS